MFAAGCFSELANDFAYVFLEMLGGLLMSSETSRVIRLAGGRAFAKMWCSLLLADRAHKVQYFSSIWFLPPSTCRRSDYNFWRITQAPYPSFPFCFALKVLAFRTKHFSETILLTVIEMTTLCTVNAMFFLCMHEMLVIIY